MLSNQPNAPKSREEFSIFHTADAPKLSEAHVLEYEGIGPISAAGLKDLQDAGLGNGNNVRKVFSVPGFHLTYAWFKSGFPLPRHSHRADCLYYIIGGSLRLGNQVLSRHDGFFLPGGTPYMYVAGDDGVELLEFRHDYDGDVKILAENSAFWLKALETTKTRSADWMTECPPGGA